jgi:hypothetical protein
VAAPDVSFTVTVVNPCLTTAITDITFSPASLSVADGSTTTASFTIPQDAIDSANTIQDLCGAKEYAVYDTSTLVTTWASIAAHASTARTYVLTIDTTQLAYSSSTISKTLTVKTTFTDWAGNAGNSASQITLQVTSTSCDCTAMAWTAPSIATQTVQIDGSVTPSVNVPTADDSARSSTPAFENCYDGGNDCVTTGSYAADTDFRFKILGGTYAGINTSASNWLSFAADTLTIAPTDVALVGIYELVATYTPDSGTASEFVIMTLTVECVVTAMNEPSAPVSGLTQNIKGPAIEFDFTDSWV